MPVRVDVGHAHMGIVGCHRCQECKLELDSLEDGSLVMPMMVAILVKILDQFSWFAMESSFFPTWEISHRFGDC